MNFDLSPAWISLKAASVATIFTFLLGISTGWFIARYSGKLKGVIDGILMLPLVLPPTVAGFILLLILGKHGPIGKALSLFGINIIFSWPAIVIAASVVAFPLMYKTARGAFEQIDGNILNAAQTLGVSEWKVFWRVAVPLAWPGIVAGTLLSFARALGEFGAPLMVAGNIAGKTQTIPLAIYFAAEGGEMNKALIWVLCIFGISLMAIILMNYWLEYQRHIISAVGRK
jgi:molybdate transport system permease protein